MLPLLASCREMLLLLRPFGHEESRLGPCSIFPHTSLGLSEVQSLDVCMFSTPTKLRSSSRDSAYLWCSLKPEYNRKRTQWNMLVRTELMEEGWLHVNDPWGRRWLLFPGSMVCVTSQTDDLYQWLDSWNQGSEVRHKKREENMRERAWLSVTVCRDSTSALAIQLPGWWMVLEPRALEGHVQTDTNGFSLQYDFVFVVQKHLISMYWSV